MFAVELMEYLSLWAQPSEVSKRNSFNNSNTKPVLDVISGTMTVASCPITPFFESPKALIKSSGVDGDAGRNVAIFISNWPSLGGYFVWRPTAVCNERKVYPRFCWRLEARTERYLWALDMILPFVMAATLHVWAASGMFESIFPLNGRKRKR